MIEDIRGSKSICQLIGVLCWSTAKKKIRHLERKTNMILLEYEDYRPIVSLSAYQQARLLVANNPKRFKKTKT